MAHGCPTNEGDASIPCIYLLRLVYLSVERAVLFSVDFSRCCTCSCLRSVWGTITQKSSRDRGFLGRRSIEFASICLERLSSPYIDTWFTWSSDYLSCLAILYLVLYVSTASNRRNDCLYREFLWSLAKQFSNKTYVMCGLPRDV